MNFLKVNLNNENILNFFLSLFILTPVVIFFSKFVSDLFLSIVSLYTLANILKFKKHEYLKILLFYFIFIFYISINLAINNFNIILLLKSFFLIRFPLYILFPFVFADRLNFKSKIINLMFFAPILIFLINLYSQVIFNIDLFGNVPQNNYQRITSFFGDEYIAGGYLFFIFSIIILITKSFKSWHIILLIFIYLGILFSGDRTPFITTNLFLLLILLANLKKIIKLKKFLLVILTIPVLVLMLIFMHSNGKINITAFNKYENTYKDIVNDLNKSEQDKNSLGLKRWAYYGIYMKSIVIFKQNFLFGTSYKSFRIECDNKKYDKEYADITDNLEYTGCSTHPHNIYLEILSEQGILGFILLALLIYNLFIIPNSVKLKMDNSIIFKIFLIAHFFPFKPFGSIYTNFGLIMLSCTIAFYIVFNKSTQK